MPAPLPSATLAPPPEVQTSRATRPSPLRARDSNPKFDKTLRDELRGKQRSESPDAPPRQRRSVEQAEHEKTERGRAGGEQAEAQSESPSRAQADDKDAQDLPVAEVGAAIEIGAAPEVGIAPDAPSPESMTGPGSLEVPAVATDARASAAAHSAIAEELARTGASTVLQPARQRAESAEPSPAQAAAIASRTTLEDTRPADPRAEERALPAPRSAAPVVSGRPDRQAAGDDRKHEESGSRPALGRAMQVQAAVRLENATGQPAMADLSLAGRSASGESASGTTAGQLTVQSAPAAELEDSKDAFTARVVRGLGAALNQRGGVMTMRLEPPDLGQLRVHLTIARGVVTAQFQPSTVEAQALLDRSMASLRSALEGHGLTVDRLTVQAPPMTTPNMRDNPADQHAPNQRHDPDAGQGQSRGRGDGRPDSSRHPFSDPREGGNGHPRRAPLDAGADQT